MPQVFSFNSIPDFISPIFTETKFLAYLTLSEIDCIFARRPFFVVFTMRDKFNNAIPYYDEGAFTGVITAELNDGGLYYDNEKCRSYSIEEEDKLLCQFEPLSVGDDQVLDLYSSVTLEQFAGFPISISVQPYKQEIFTSDSMNSIEKASTKEMEEDSGAELYTVTLTFKGRDIYGNVMYNENICTYYLHNRFIVFFNFVIEEGQILDGTLTARDIANNVGFMNLITVYVNETYDAYTGYKQFAFITRRPSTVTFSHIRLNYTLIDGFNYKNGLLVKYYSNNNFVGKPLYMARIPTSYIDGDERQSYWHEMHNNNKEFSVKMSTLMYIP